MQKFLSLIKPSVTTFSRIKFPIIPKNSLPGKLKFREVFFAISPRSFIGADFTFMTIGFCKMDIIGDFYMSEYYLLICAKT